MIGCSVHTGSFSSLAPMNEFCWDISIHGTLTACLPSLLCAPAHWSPSPSLAFLHTCSLLHFQVFLFPYEIKYAILVFLCLTYFNNLIHFPHRWQDFISFFYGWITSLCIYKNFTGKSSCWIYILFFNISRYCFYI